MGQSVSNKQDRVGWAIRDSDTKPNEKLGHGGVAAIRRRNGRGTDEEKRRDLSRKSH